MKRTIAVAAATLAAAAIAIPLGAVPAPAQSSPIQHVVVLDLENHSFQNLLGFWCQNNPRCGSGDAMPASVTLSNGAVVTPSTDPDIVPPVDHSMKSQLAAMNKGQMNGWESQKNGCGAATHYACVSGYQSSQVPNLTALAGAYAMSDRFFSMKDSPSWGGHMYAVAGTTDGFTGDNPHTAPGVAAANGWGCDSNKVAAWGSFGFQQGVDQPSCVPDYGLGLPNGGAFEPTRALYVPTIMDRLDAAGLSWSIYGATGGPSYIWSVCPTFAECLYGPQKQHMVDQPQFFADAQAGTLPNYSLITGDGATSCHNGAPMSACDSFIGQVASAVMNSPEWSSTALFITMDDYGGFYDSVPPGVNPDSTQQGPRLPLVVVSPYAVPASTDSTPSSFASILAFVEHNFGLEPMEANDQNAYPLTGMFNTAAPPRLGHRPAMVTRPIPRGDHIVWSELRQGS